jgi:divalent metal cation (Fe/Co/Zn/Cd) transporter
LKNVEAIRQAIKLHLSVVEVVELLTMHRAPKQILVNAHVNLRNDLTNEQIIESIAGIEENMKKVEPKVDMIFLETASLKNSESKEINSKHIG